MAPPQPLSRQPMYNLVKGIADNLIRRLSQALPAWQHYEVEKTFPACAPYQPTPPANMSMFSAEVVRRFSVPVDFPAHHIYRLHNVHVTWDGAVFHNFRLFVPSIVHVQFAERFQDALLLRQWIGERVEVPVGCVAVCHDQWSVENYYHWLVDTLPRLLVLRQSHPDMLLLLPQPMPPKQLPDYISQSATVLGFTNYLPLHSRQILRAGCVVLPELTAPSLTHNPELIRQVRTELLAALSPEPHLATRKIYAARAAGGVRSVVNEAEVDSLLQALGFEKIYFEQLTFLEQIHLMRETTVFLGIHGAGMANMLFLPDGAKVIELLNEEYGDRCYFRLASCLGLPYFLAPCTGISKELANQSDMVINSALLAKVVAAALC
jgi:Glycosyltransferase 61